VTIIEHTKNQEHQPKAAQAREHGDHGAELERTLRHALALAAAERVGHSVAGVRIPTVPGDGRALRPRVTLSGTALSSGTSLTSPGARSSPNLSRLPRVWTPPTRALRRCQPQAELRARRVTSSWSAPAWPGDVRPRTDRRRLRRPHSAPTIPSRQAADQPRCTPVHGPTPAHLGRFAPSLHDGYEHLRTSQRGIWVCDTLSIGYLRLDGQHACR
jgi:hypothetical protein